jgi:hypothetical protein
VFDAGCWKVLVDTAFRQVCRPCVFGGSVVVLIVFIILMLELTAGIQQDCFNTRLVNYDNRVARRFRPVIIKRSSGYASRATYRIVLCVKFILDSGQFPS